MDPGAAYTEGQTAIDTSKTPRRAKRGRQPSRGRVDMGASTVSETEEIVTVKTGELLMEKNAGRGRSGKGGGLDEVEQQLPARTPAR